MARKQVYSGVTVSRFINVSSSGHHFADVGYRKSGARYHGSICIEGGYQTLITKRGYRNLPKYVAKAIRQQLLGVLQSGKVIYYEYDRDGHRRYENLRYHLEGWEQSVITWLEEHEQQDTTKAG